MRSEVWVKCFCPNVFANVFAMFLLRPFVGPRQKHFSLGKNIFRSQPHSCVELRGNSIIAQISSTLTMGSASALCHRMQWVYLPNPLLRMPSMGVVRGWGGWVWNFTPSLRQYIIIYMRMFDDDSPSPAPNRSPSTSMDVMAIDDGGCCSAATDGQYIH